MTDAEKVVKALRRMHNESAVAPWELATTVERGEHARTPIGLVSGCLMTTEPEHSCLAESEHGACLHVEFGRIHLNDSAKPPLHPDNKKEIQTALAIVALRNALPALAEFVQAASTVYDECGAVGCPSNGSVEKQSAALARLAQTLGVGE